MQPGTDYAERSDQRSADEDALAAQRPGKPVRRSRIGLLLLLAFGIEVIAIAAAGNQAVIDAVEKHPGNAESIDGGLRRSLETYGWRFSPRAHDVFHVWAGGLALIGATIVVSLLLIAAIVRGPFSFVRAFVGTWLAVVGATLIGGYVRALVIDTPAYSHHGIPARALFSPLAPGANNLLAGIALGLLVALVIGFVGLATRRPPEVAPGASVADGDHYLDDRFGAQRDDDQYRPAQYGDNTYRDEHYDEPARADSTTRGYGTVFDPTPAVPWSARSEQGTSGSATDSTDTTALPAMRPRESAPEQPTAATREAGADSENATTALPAHEPSRETAPEPSRETAHEPSRESARETAPTRTAQRDDETAQLPTEQRSDETAQFPRPPDDEDLDPERH